MDVTDEDNDSTTFVSNRLDDKKGGIIINLQNFVSMWVKHEEVT